MPATARKSKTNGPDMAAETCSARSSTGIQARVDAVDWTKVLAELDAQGWAVVPKLLTHAEADGIASLYHQEQGFRSQIIMARHGFGRGECAVIGRARSALRRYSLSTRRGISTASIATFTESMYSRCRSRSCWISQARTSRVASS